MITKRHRTIRYFSGTCLVRPTAALCAAAVLAAGSNVTPAAAKTVPANRVLAYFLPKLQISPQISVRLLACPQGKEGPKLASAVVVTQEYIPDPTAMVKVDTSAHLFANRTVKLELNPDGTLSTFNASSEGQGGKILTSIVKAAATVLPMVAGATPMKMDQPPDETGLKCNDATVAKLEALAATKQGIKQIEDRLIAGQGQPTDADMLTALKARQSEQIKGLTLIVEPKASVEAESDVKKEGPPKATGPIVPGNNAVAEYFSLLQPSYENWFAKSPEGTTVKDLPGMFGFRVSIDPVVKMASALKQEGSTLPGGPSTDLFYRRPVPGVFKIYPCADRQCISDEKAPPPGFSSVTPIRVPQWSGFQSLKIGKGGLFGTRQANAKFDAAGAPLLLEYGSKSGADDLSGVVDAGTAGVSGLRDAELNELNRQINLAKARKELATLTSEEE
ncbi:MAG TPA: hypothetical protein VEZ26_02105 [Sphingomonadaceae bacterium]|nr:hypothetical protein [Sphingomonadaceae bacterium]